MTLRPQGMTCALVMMAFLAGIASCPAAGASGRTVAVTFDDLPFAAEGDVANDPEAAREANTAILAALQRRAVPAIGFVTERSVQRLSPVSEELLAGWSRSPHELGNHGFSHADVNTLDLDGVRREIEQGEATIARMAAAAGRELRFFRFPMNHVGETNAKRVAIEACWPNAATHWRPRRSTLPTICLIAPTDVRSRRGTGRCSAGLRTRTSPIALHKLPTTPI
ncbi:polysaccharide deacetylase family protein [Luteimonas sp. FCS-9]|uniref:polysaccharide deacetylase family protein n=1 Tax=Luteimonas sp. FCS-9 TaxID=1547516 RepID=UPI0009E505F9|nr:polysaccharide deacetylase family protein [Luteimonas sp. FCS-9]